MPDSPLQADLQVGRSDSTSRKPAIYLYPQYILDVWWVQVNRRFAGSAARAPDLRDTRKLTSGRRSQVIDLAARVQSCICWSSETRAAGVAPEQLPTEIGVFLRFQTRISPRRAVKIRMKIVYEVLKPGGCYM